MKGSRWISGRTVLLRDGTAVRLRPIRSEDAAALTQLYGRLSPETAYQRFFTVMRRLPPDWARILADVDHDRNAAIVAAGPDGGARRRGAVQHADRRRRGRDRGRGRGRLAARGLGTILLSALLDHGRSRGIGRFLAHVLADNQRMLRLIGRLGTADGALARPGHRDRALHASPGCAAGGARATLGNSG